MKNVKYSELDSILVLKSYNPIFKISKYLGKRLTGSSLKHSVLQSYRCLTAWLVWSQLGVPDPIPVLFWSWGETIAATKSPNSSVLTPGVPGSGSRMASCLRWCVLVWAVTWPRPRRHFPGPGPGHWHTWPRHVLGRNYQDLAWPGPCVLWSSVSRSDHNKGHIRHKHSKVDTKCTPLSFSLSHKARRATRR